MLRQVRRKRNHNKQKQKKDYRQWYFGTINEKGSLEFNTVKNEIENKFNTTISSTTFPMKVTIENTNYIVDNKGKVEIKDILSAEYNRDGIEIGDYIEYAPDLVTVPYPKEKLTNQYTGADDTPGRKNNDIPQENLRWKVFRKYDDGSMDIVSDDTTSRLILDRSQGYNNGVFILNDIAKRLYSKPSKGIYARHINLEDIEYHLNKTTKGKKVVEGTETGYGWNYAPRTYSTGDNIEKIDYLQSEQGKGRSDSIITEPITTGLSQTIPSGKTVTVPKTVYYMTSDGIDMWGTQGVVNTIVGINYSYWFASRIQNMGIIYFDSGAMGDRTFTGYNYNLGMKFVVRLNSTTKLQKSTDASNAGGTPHKILEY